MPCVWGCLLIWGRHPAPNSWLSSHGQPGFHIIFSLLAFEGQACCRSNPEHPRASHLPLTHGSTDTHF